MENEDLTYYMSLPYMYQLRYISEGAGGYYFISIQELEGCQSDGQTVGEAFKNIREAMQGYIEVMLENGDPVPEPKRN